MSDQKKLSAEKYLQQLETLDTNINQNLERLADMQINMCNVGGIDYSAERVQTTLPLLVVLFGYSKFTESPNSAASYPALVFALIKINGSRLPPPYNLALVLSLPGHTLCLDLDFFLFSLDICSQET